MIEELWVFGYGSLLWNPEINVAETRPATLRDFRRSFCMWSVHHRGSEDRPGLVLALEPAPGELCHGLAMRAADPVPALAALRARELVSAAYVEEVVSLDTPGGPVTSRAYVIDRDHRQYARDLSLEDQARVIAAASGGRGPNHEYLDATAHALRDLDIPAPELDELVARVQQIRAADAPAERRAL